MCKVLSGISTLSSSLKLILPEMPMIPSLSPTQKKPQSRISSTLKQLRTSMKKEDLAVKDTTMNGTPRKHLKMC
jgi:hypothetical protein